MKGFFGIKIPDKTKTETTIHYMTASRDKTIMRIFTYMMAKKNTGKQLQVGNL